MARSDEINSCEPIPGSPIEPRQVPREQIFCDNVTVQKDLNVLGETQLNSLSIGTTDITDPTKGITINGTTYVPAIIVTPGPLAGVVLSLPDGTPAQFLPGTAILIAASPDGASTI
jgi:hypothetical protein